MPDPSHKTAPLTSVKSGRLNEALRIGVDVRGLEFATTRRRGIGRYVINLIRALSRIAPQHRLVLFTETPPWKNSVSGEFSQYGNIEFQTYSPSFYRGLNAFLLTDPLPLMHDRDLLPYSLNGLPCATVFYDLIPLAFPDRYLHPDPKLQKQYLTTIDQLREIASCYLPISEFVGDDLVKRLHIDRKRILPILGGLDPVFKEMPAAAEVAETLKKNRIHGKYFFYPGGSDYRKNLNNLIKAFRRFRDTVPEPVQLVLVGEIDEWRKREIFKLPEMESLKNDVLALGYVPDEELRCIYAGAVAMLMPSLYEGFGLPALEAMACGCPVIVSNGTSLKEIVADAGILVDPLSGEEISAAMLKLLRDNKAAAVCRKKGRARAPLYTWEKSAEKTLQALSSIALPGRKVVAPTRKMKVLIQNRDNAFIAPGGDTVVMENIFRSCRRADIDADVATGRPDLTDIDLVHIVNLTVSPMAADAAANASHWKVPSVVTTLFEDWPRYLERSIACVDVFRKYLESGQNDGVFCGEMEKLRRMPVGPSVGNDSVVEAASALIACGESEAVRLRRSYPAAENKVEVIPFGITDLARNVCSFKDKIHEKLGFDSYVLCCGRPETRKNQLMLLKALENDDIPIVLVTGGFTYQESYLKLITSFRRRGPVKILGRMNSVVLANLMAAAEAHVLPSWFELPGLVTLEAASCGTAVVASDWGAVTDYLPDDLVHLCRPDDPESVRKAVFDAIKAGPDPRTVERAASYTWEDFGEKLCGLYERVLSGYGNKKKKFHGIKNKTPVEVEMTTESPRKKFDVSIIIPVYNRSNLTQECLEAICMAGDKSEYEVIIVDNHSTDDTPRILEAVEGDVKVLREPENRGFAAACNLGARLADGELLLFLNNDTQPYPGWLDTMVNCCRRQENVGVVGARLTYVDGRIQHAGVAVNKDGIPYHVFQQFAAEDPAVMEERDMAAVTAACMLVPITVFEDCGGFDEAYQNGSEDVDFCLKVREKGLRVVYCPEARVMHHEESSEGRSDHDLDNLDRLRKKWKEKLIPDENELLARFGYKITWGSKGGKYELLRQTVDTVESLDKVRENLSESPLERAKTLYAEGRFEEATQTLQQLVEDKMLLAGQDGFETWQTLGNCLARLNQAEEAEQAYMKAMKLDNSSERPYLGLGTVAMLKENWSAAQYGFMAAVARNPQTVKGEFGVGVALAARGRHVEAVEHFQKVAGAEPENAEALFYLYRSAMEAGQPQVAVGPLEQYVKKHPDDALFQFNLCGALWKAGELTRAVEVCRRVIELDPNHEAAQEVMGHLKTTLRSNA